MLPESAEVLDQSSWGCAGLASEPGTIRLRSTSGFASRINWNGPQLRVNGDFSITATFTNSSASGGWVQAVGSLGSDPMVFWKDLKKVDFGVNGNSAHLIVWNGEQSSAVVNRSFGLNAAPNADVTLELARIGTDLVLFSGTRELGRVADPGVYSRNQVRFGLLAGQGNEIIVSSLRMATRAGAETTAQVTRFVARTAARSGEGLRDLPGARDFMIGASVVTSRFESESARNTLGREFNMLVAGNAMRWESLQPEPGRLAFCEADQLIEFAAANGQQVRGHVLVWGLQLSSWVERGTWTRETLLAAMRAHR